MNDVKKFMIGSMHRTGHHAVAVWLLHQLEGVHDFDINSITPWLFYLYNNQEQVRYLANNPLKVPMLSDGKSYQLFGSDGKGNHGLSVEHPDKVHFDKIMKDYHEANSNTNLIIGTHEQKKLKDVAWAAGCSDVFGVNTSLVVVLRDFRNWVASCIKMAHRDEKPLEEIMNDDKVNAYVDHCKYYMDIKGENCILFNRWVSDENYRREVAEMLGVHFTDAALDQLSPFGGGSSFTKMRFLKNASQMNVNSRYQNMTEDDNYNRIINSNKEALEMSNEIFGSTN